MERRKTLLGLSKDSQQSFASIRLEVSEAVSKHFNLYHINAAKLEDLKQFRAMPNSSYQTRLDNLSGLKPRMKFMRNAMKQLLTEPGTGSEFLHQLHVLYVNLEQELGYPITPVLIEINDALTGGEYRIVGCEQVQTQGEISLSSDEALTDESMQDLLQQIKVALLSTRKQQ